MSDVFVSYKAEDRRRVKPLVDALEADGFSVWWDEQIGGGSAWRHEIETQLNAAPCVIVIWSKRSVGPEGTFVHDEAARAQQRQVYVPVTIDKVHLPLGFGETQALPLTGWHGSRSDARYQAVLNAVRRLATGDSGAPAMAHTEHKAISRRGVLAGSAAAAVATAGVGSWLFLRPESAAAMDSIAVLPFANLSGDPAQAYFSDGIAEELRSALARLAGLKVVGRTSSEAVRNDDAETAAEKLGVTHILTGSVRQSPSVIRVNAQLIDGKSGLERWSQNYDRAPGDAIKIQTDIAENVARALSAALGAAAGAALTLGGTSNAAAQNFVLQAGEAINERTRAGTERAIQLIDEALRLDPNYADAYARKAIYITILGDIYATGTEELARSRAKAFQAARKAAALEPNLARAHIALARLYSSQLEVARASSAFRRALQLAPGDGMVLRRFSSFVSATNPSEGLRLADKAIELDPLNPDAYVNRGWALFNARRYDEAVQCAQETARRSPDLIENQGLLGFCFLVLGKLSEASQHFSQLPADHWMRLKGEAMVFARAGDRAGAELKLQQMHRLFGESMSAEYAAIYAQLGAKDRAIAALERGWTFRDPGLLGIRVDPLLDPLRGDPRFQAIVRQMNFPA